QREHRGADDHPQRVGGDQVAGAGDARVRVGGHLGAEESVGDPGQEAHGRELGGADAHPAEGEGEQGEAAAACGDLVRGGGARVVGRHGLGGGGGAGDGGSAVVGGGSGRASSTEEPQ